MAEIKNTFLKGKMNKDLDERILPKGEYRHAQNILISDSEDSDVGSVENVLGNKISHGSITASGTTETIGYYVDITTKRAFWFITDFTGDDNDILTMSRASVANSNICKIIMREADGNIVELVSGVFLNFSKAHLITGVNLIDDLLFWTDDYNQPRKINIETAKADTSYYDSEEKISVAKVAPYCAPVLNDTSGVADGTTIKRDTNIKSEYLKENFVRFSYRYKFDDGEYSPIAPFTQVVFKPLNNGVISPLIDASTADSKNSVSGEPDVFITAEDIYKKGTVDIMENNYNFVELRIPLPNTDEFKTSAYSPTTTYSNDYKIKEIEILLKESDGVAVQVVANIKANSSDFTGNIEQYTIVPVSGTTYYRQQLKYIYRSEKPYKVLPEDQTTRVYDQVPLRAKAQEIVGNRVVYGNFTENYNIPNDENGRKGINYLINATVKGAHEAGASAGQFQHLEKTYKFNSIKQRRTYQVGIVLADRFGRQSPVILSTNTDATDGKSDTFTVPNDTNNRWDTSNSRHSWSSAEEAIGKSLDIEFKDTRLVPSSSLYSASNPNGWYSWRIVVKQTEQDYYNVYAPHPADNWNNIEHKADNTTSGRSWLVLYGDNINKIPSISSDDDISRPGVLGSDMRLFPKVISSSANAQYSAVNTDSNDKLIDVITIGTAKDQNLFLQATNADYKGETSGTTGYSVLPFVYGSDKNPLVAEIPNLSIVAGTSNSAGVKASVSGTASSVNQTVFGDAGDFLSGMVVTGPTISPVDVNTPVTLNGNGSGSSSISITLSEAQSLTAKDLLFFSSYKDGLSVFETYPFESRLDIYYETSTCGLVKDLNLQMEAGAGSAPSNLRWSGGNTSTQNLPENTSSGTTLTYSLTADAANSGAISFQLLSAETQGGTDVTSKFSVNTSSGAVSTSADFAYANDANQDTIILSIRFSESGGGSATDTINVAITNSSPTITSAKNTSSNRASVAVDASTNTLVFDGTATNGAQLSTADKSGLSYSIDLPGTSYDNYFAVTSSSPGNYEVKTTANFDGDTFKGLSESNRNSTVTVTDAGGLQDTHQVGIDVIDTRVTASLRYSASFQACSSGTTATYYIEQGSGASLTANKLVVGNVIFDTATTTTRSSIGEYRFQDPVDGNYYKATFTGSTAATRTVTAISLCT